MAETFPLTSRYYYVKTTTLKTPDGRIIGYLRRRFIPPPERFELLHFHTVTEGNRLDNLSHEYLGASDQFWRICDANRAMIPDGLVTEINKQLRITLPEGILGVPSE